MLYFNHNLVKSPNEQEADLLALYTYGQLLELVTTLTNRANRKMAGLNPGTSDNFAKLLISRFFFSYNGRIIISISYFTPKKT